MAAIENLEIVVDVKIGEAISNLQQLQEELADLADAINDVDARGTEGIDINTTLDNLDSELAALETELETFEENTSVEIPVELDRRNFKSVKRRVRDLDTEEVTATARIRTSGEDHAREKIDNLMASREAPLTIRVSEDGLEETLTRIRTEIAAFERAHTLDISVNYDEKNIDQIISTVRNVGNTKVRPEVQFDVQSEAIDDAEQRLSSIASDLGLGGLEDGQLTVDSMRVAAGRVTVLGGEDGGTAEAISDVLSSFSVDVGEEQSREIQVSERDFSGAKKPLTGPGFLTMGSPTAADAEKLRKGMGNLFGEDTGPDVAGPAGRAQRLMNNDDQSVGMNVISGLVEQFDNLSESVSNFDLRMSDIHNAMARLVPMLLIFVGVMPAAITAVLGLAAAAMAAAAGLSALTGLGALGLALEGGQVNMSNLRDAAKQVKEDFIEAFAPLAERLQPLFEDALNGLTRFFEAVAGQGDALIALADEARAFGGFLMEFIPMVINAMAAMADALSPLLASIGNWMKQNLHQVVRTLVKLTAQAAPVIGQLARKIGGMLPALVQMSIGFAKIANIILSIIGLFGRFIAALGLTPRLFGLITAGALAAASAILLANSALIGLIVEGFLTLAGAVYSFFVPAVATIVSGFTSSAVATYIATAALASFLTLITLGAGLALVAMATSAAASFLGLADSIGKATSNLKEYNRVSGRTSDDGPNPYNGGIRGAQLGAGGPRGGNVTVIESSGNDEQARSQGAYAAWRQGRTTGDNP